MLNYYVMNENSFTVCFHRISTICWALLANFNPSVAALFFVDIELRERIHAETAFRRLARRAADFASNVPSSTPHNTLHCDTVCDIWSPSGINVTRRPIKIPCYVIPDLGMSFQHPNFCAFFTTGGPMTPLATCACQAPYSQYTVL